ncbi:hypothetical protein KY366_07905 [Candidatus Woesearchaeota archaeon]|nr:hypothetical protein [Candidatus Woesearchaeota archaeon]
MSQYTSVGIEEKIIVIPPNGEWYYLEEGSGKNYELMTDYSEERIGGGELPLAKIAIRFNVSGEEKEKKLVNKVNEYENEKNVQIDALRIVCLNDILTAYALREIK